MNAQLTFITQEEIFFNFLKLPPGRPNHFSLQFSASNCAELNSNSNNNQVWSTNPFKKHLKDSCPPRQAILLLCMRIPASFAQRKQVCSRTSVVDSRTFVSKKRNRTASKTLNMQVELDFTVQSQNSNCYWYVWLWLILKIHYINLLWVITSF